MARGESLGPARHHGIKGAARSRSGWSVRAGHPRRVPRRGCREHSGEPLTEHECLVLQHRVEQPQGGQGQLPGSPPAGRFPRRCVASARRPRAVHPPTCSARCRGARCRGGFVARARQPRAIHPPACSARCRGRPRVGRPRCSGPGAPAIHPLLAANSQSQCGLLDRRTSRGYYDAQSIGSCPMIRQRRWRAAAARERAGSGPATRGFSLARAVSTANPGSPAIPRRRIMDTPKVYSIPVVHCGGTRVWNVIADPGQCVLQIIRCGDGHLTTT